MYSISILDSVMQQFNQAVDLVGSNIAAYCIDPTSNFTRNRKLDAKTLIHFLVAMQGKSLNCEICDYFHVDPPSASAVYQARQKLLPSALRQVFHRTNRLSLNADKTLKGWHILACDGSAIDISYNPEDTETLQINKEYGTEYIQSASSQCPFRLFERYLL